MHMTRREALRHLSAGSLLALGLWPGALRAKDNPDSSSFRFLVVNDTHYMSPECGEWLNIANPVEVEGSPMELPQL